jgi:hypothetical protein
VISNLDGVFAVLDSAGTTEYAFTIQGAFNSDDGPPLTKGYRLQLGFGKGASFVPASAVAADLDFDFPQPSDPALPTSISLFGITPLFDLKSHNSDTITWSGHPFTGSFFHTSLFRLPLDVPDLPASVMSYYQPGDLPSDFPAGAKAFTIRGGFVPEPCSQSIALVALAVLATRRHSRRRLRLADAQAPEMTSGASSPPILPRASAMAALAAIMSTAAQLQGATFKVSSLVTGPHYELKSFVAGGKRYLQSDLIQPTMTAFLGDGSIDGPEGAPLPPAGTRTQLATHDYLLNTGLSDVESAELTFTPPLINGPGPDLVIFDEDYYDPEDIDLMIIG